MNERKGLLLVFLTALVSGISIFANSFAVQGFNPFVFTFLKNAAVAAFLFSALLLLKELNSLKALSPKNWARLASIGLLGGSVPFLLYFYALKLSTAASAGFFHKTLFFWAAVFAAFFLKEKIDRRFLAAAALLLAGNFLVFGIASFAFPELLILAATVLWAAENTLSKHALKELSGSMVAFGRMFFGSIFILAFLASTGQLSQAFSLSFEQLAWAGATSGFLFFYVLTYYNGLKHIPLHKAASILLLAQPITAFLSFAFLQKPFSLQEAFGFLLIVSGVLLLFSLSQSLNSLKTRVPSIAARL
jgi:drug/metabolite transporter (DMT)-like permease